MKNKLFRALVNLFKTKYLIVVHTPFGDMPIMETYTLRGARQAIRECANLRRFCSIEEINRE